MRFVKNLIAAVALATTVLNGVVGAPAGNTHPTLLDPIKSFPPSASTVSSEKSSTTTYHRGGGLPHFTPTINVGGSSLSLPVEGWSTRSIGAPSGSLPIEGDPAHPTGTLSLESMPITTVSPTDLMTTVSHRKSHGVSESPTSSNPISVTERDGSLDARQRTDKMPDLAVETKDDVEERQVLPTSINGRQILPTSITEGDAQETKWVDPPISAPSIGDVDERQVIMPTSNPPRDATHAQPSLGYSPTPDVAERQVLPTSINARAKPSAPDVIHPPVVGGPHPNPDVAERQVIMPTSNPPLDATHAQPSLGYSPTPDVAERQVLPTSISARGGAVVSWVNPPTGGGNKPWLIVDERQVLPTSITAESTTAALATPTDPGDCTRCVGGCACNPSPPASDELVTLTESTTTTVTETFFSGSCVGGCAVTSITSLDVPADTEAAGHVEFAQPNEGVVSTITQTDLHTTIVSPPSTRETTTVTSTQYFTITVPKSTSDNCTVPTSTASWSNGTVTTLTPTITETSSETSTHSPPTNGTLTITRRSSSAAETEVDTKTGMSTSASSTETTSSSTETISSWSTSVPISVTTITTLTDGCNHETCGPTTQTITSTLEPSPSSLPLSITAFPTSTAAAVNGTASTSIDTCTLTASSTSTSTSIPTSTSTSTSASTLTTSSAEETTLITVTTHSTLTLTHSPRQGPPHLTPPAITRRADGPPEAGPPDVPPHVTSTTTTDEVPKPSSPIDTPIGGASFSLPWDGGRPHRHTSSATGGGGANGTYTGPWASTTTLTSAAGGLNPTPSSWRSTFTGPWASTTTLVTSVITAPV